MVALLLLFSVVLSTHSDYTISAADLIQAYCKLVQPQTFYNHFRLRDLCALNVKIFKDKVKMAYSCDYVYFTRVFNKKLLNFSCFSSILTKSY